MLRFFKKLAYEIEKEFKSKNNTINQFFKKILKKRPLFNLIFK